MAGHACALRAAVLRAWHATRVAAAGNGTAGLATAVFKAADYSPPLASGMYTLRAVFDPSYGARQNHCHNKVWRSG